MNDKIFLISANPYNFTDSSTGEIKKGVSISYVMSSELNPTIDSTTGLRGYRVLKGSLPAEAVGDLKDVPGAYDCCFGIKAGSNGKSELKPLSIASVKA